MSYTDLTSEFVYKDLVKWVSMDALAENDKYNHFVSGTVALFYQASAPTGWTKGTGHNNKAFRVVGGAGGGGGGTQGLDATINFNHAHSPGIHTHTTLVHSHVLAYSSGGLQTGKSVVAGGLTGEQPILVVQTTSVGVSTWYVPKNISDDTTSSNGTQMTGTSTDNQLVGLTLQLAYADVIVCMKD